MRTGSALRRFGCALLLTAILAPAARAGILQFERSFNPGVPPRVLAEAGSGSVLVINGNTLRRHDPTWALAVSVSNYTPGITSDPFVYLEGGLRFADGRLLAYDQGGIVNGTIVASRYVIFDATGNSIAEWAAPRGVSGMSSPRLASDGGFIQVVNNYGIASLTRRNSSGAVTASWTVKTAAYRLAVRGGVVYLAGDASGKIHKFSEDGISLGSISTVVGSFVAGIDVDDFGRIFVLGRNGSGGSILWVLSPNGVKLDSADRPGTNGSFSAPSDVVVMGNSKVLLPDGSWNYGGIHEFSIDSPVPTVSASWGRVKALYR